MNVEWSYILITVILAVIVLAGVGVGIYFAVKKSKQIKQLRKTPIDRPPIDGPPINIPIAGPPINIPIAGPPINVPIAGPPINVPIAGPPIIPIDRAPINIPIDIDVPMEEPPIDAEPIDEEPIDVAPVDAEPVDIAQKSKKPTAKKPAPKKPAPKKPPPKKPPPKKPEPKPPQINPSQINPTDEVRGDPMPIPRIEKGGPWRILKFSKSNISSDGLQIRISLDGNVIGSKSGGYLYAAPPGLPGARAATLSFSVFVPGDFPTEKRGGKLPGLCIGTKAGECATGNDWKDNAGSMRWMFRQGGAGFMQAILYIYMPWSGGSSREKMLNAFNAQGTAYKSVASTGGGSAGHNLFYQNKDANAAAFKLRAGQWNTMTMSLTLNSSPTASNGSISASVNGVTKSISGVRFTNNAQAKISSIDFVSFAGGSSNEWKLGKPSYFAFKDIRFAAWT